MNQTEKTEKDFEPNVAAALSYLIPPITGMVFFIREKENMFVRFHAYQAIIFGCVSWILYWLFSFSVFTIFGYFLRDALTIFIFLIWVFLMWKAYSNEEYELPYLGKFARDQAQKK